MSIDKLLLTFLSKGVKFYPATNSLKFHSNDDSDKNYLWIEPPWRIVRESTVIASSFTCPWHEDFQTKEDYSKAFNEWCETMRYLNQLEIKEHSVKKPLNDLVIKWTDGTTLEVFQKGEQGDSWYIADKTNKKYFLALPGRIEIKEMSS